MPMLKHVTWSAIVVLLTTCMNLVPEDDGTTASHRGGTTYINTGGWSSGGHK